MFLSLARGRTSTNLLLLSWTVRLLVCTALCSSVLKLCSNWLFVVRLNLLPTFPKLLRLTMTSDCGLMTWLEVLFTVTVIRTLC